MRTTPIMKASGLLACGAVLAVSAVLAGCGSGGGSGSGSGAAAHSSTTPDTSTESVVQCYRSHGDPSFPDPVYDPNDGRWHFAISPGSAPMSTYQACRHLFPSVNPSPPVPLAQFQQLVRLAQCIRQHGVPNWPDPDPNGSFPMPPPLQTKNEAVANAMTACQRYTPSGGINVHAVP